MMEKKLWASSSKRHFQWSNKVGSEDVEEESPAAAAVAVAGGRKVGVWRVRSVVAAALRKKKRGELGSRVVGTLFGCRRGHVHLAFQKDPSSPPALLIELATPISGLVSEMASGLVRIALECDKQQQQQQQPHGMKSLLEEGSWRTYCNGKKSGLASRREWGEWESKVLKAVEPISMGAGVLPMPPHQDDVMYMRAKFQRVVGSAHSQAFYMMNPDTNGAPELSVYLLRL